MKLIDNVKLSESMQDKKDRAIAQGDVGGVADYSVGELMLILAMLGCAGVFVLVALEAFLFS